MSEPTWPPEGPWPSTPGGIRGADGSTLQDLKEALIGTDPAFPSLRQLLEEMRDNMVSLLERVELLTGGAADAPAGWVGLPNYLYFTLGPATDEPASTLRILAMDQITELATLNTRLNAAGFTPLAGTNPAGAALATLTSEAAERSTARFNIGSIQAALGSLGSDPAGFTVKQLLAAIQLASERAADCCEEGATEPPPNTENPEPAGGCEAGEYGWVRNSSWLQANTPDDLGGDDYDAYAPDWANIATWFDGDLVRDFDTTIGVEYPGIVSTGADFRVCLKWDFTDNVPPQLVNFYRFGTGDFYPVGGGTPTAVSPLNVPVGSYSTVVNAGVRWAFVVLVPVGAGPPGNNLWLDVESVAA